MTHDDREACIQLLETAGLVGFDILEQTVASSPAAEDDCVRLELQLKDPEDYPTDEYDRPPVEWGAFGFLFAVAACSFADARPTRDSGDGYRKKDRFSVADFFHYLGFVGAR